MADYYHEKGMNDNTYMYIEGNYKHVLGQKYVQVTLTQGRDQCPMYCKTDTYFF